MFSTDNYRMGSASKLLLLRLALSVWVVHGLDLRITSPL